MRINILFFVVFCFFVSTTHASMETTKAGESAECAKVFEKIESSMNKIATAYKESLEVQGMAALSAGQMQKIQNALEKMLKTIPEECAQ